MHFFHTSGTSVNIFSSIAYTEPDAEYTNLQSCVENFVFPSKLFFLFGDTHAYLQYAYFSIRLDQMYIFATYKL